MPSPCFVFSSLHSGRGPQRPCDSHELVRLYPEASILFPLQTAPPWSSPLGVSGTPPPGLLQDSQRVRGHLLSSPLELLAGCTVPGGRGTLGAPGEGNRVG